VVPFVFLAALGCGSGGTGVSGVEVLGSVGRQPGQFAKPRGLAFTNDNLLYVIDRSGRVQLMNPGTGDVVSRWELPEWSNGTPTGATVDLDGQALWIADTHYQQILRYNTEGELVCRWGEDGTDPGQLIFPTDIAPDPDGETVWICEYGLRARVMQFTRDGEFLKEWGSEEYEYTDLQRPMAITVSEDGLIYLADAGNHRIQVYDREGNLVNMWGEPGTEPGQLKYPYDMAFAPDGTLYICEYGNSRISRFTPDGEYLGSWGMPGYRVGELNTPWGLAVAPDGTLAIADTSNGRVQLIERPDRRFTRGDAI